jgi:hypothetical protein
MSPRRRRQGHGLLGGRRHDVAAPEVASTSGSVAAREVTASVAARSPPPKLSVPDDCGGATGLTTSVATASPLLAYSANGSA